jgi:tRNA/rRNA methyltransferase
MSGTDSSRADGPLPPAPAVILVNPQLGENIGGCARAMLNCGLTDLRLVKPRDGWPNPVAKAMAVGAVSVLETAKVFETTAEACADLSFVLATTARTRDMMKPVFTPRAAIPELRGRIALDQAVGVMFGPERSGLTNDDLVVADAILNVPLNPAFSSLNLAQAVLLIGYEWWQATDQTPDYEIGGGHEPAPIHLRQYFLDRLERELDARSYFHPPQTAPIMKQNLRVMLTRAGFSEDELSTLHGVLKSLLTRDPKG